MPFLSLLHENLYFCRLKQSEVYYSKWGEVIENHFRQVEKMVIISGENGYNRLKEKCCLSFC